MADISEDDRSIVFTRPAPGFRFNPTRRQVEQVGRYVLAASRAKIDTFLESLPTLSLADLPEDNVECPICTETYQVSQNSDVPVRLTCSHIIGKDCLSKWLNSSVRNANNNGVSYIFYYIVPYFDLVLSLETCFGSFYSSDMSRDSLVFLRREVLTPKSFSALHAAPSCSIATVW